MQETRKEFLEKSFRVPVQYDYSSLHILMAAATAVLAVFFTAMTALASAAISSVTVASAASATVNELAVKSFSKFLLCRFTYCKYLTCEMKGLAGHLVVEIHLDAVSAYLKHYTRNHTAHRTDHRNCIARYEKILANLPVHFECCFRQVNDPLRVNFSVSVSWRKSYVELASWLHTFDVSFELWQKAACSVNIVKRSFLCCVVDYLSVDLKFVAEFHYCILCDFHIFNVLSLIIIFICPTGTAAQRLG
jgi:hypothetical protein